MTTVKELSEQLGVSKTSILKFCKEELKLQTTARRSLQLSANQCSVIANRFPANDQVKRESTENQTENHLQTCVQLSADEFADLKTRLAASEAECAGLRREIELLRERLEVADKALEREQLQARGFWSRLGQKLLGGGEGE